MDRRLIYDGSLLCLTYLDGGEHVLHAKTEPAAARPNASENHAVDAHRLYVFLPVVPRRPRALLAL